MVAENEKRGPTLAEKLDRLFKAVRPDGRREYTYDEVVEGIERQGSPSLARSYLWALRTGAKDNPRKKHIEALARFFNVPVTYFFDDAEATQLYERLALLPAHEDNEVQRIALRAADLSPDSLRAIAQIVEQARKIEGLRAGRQGVRRPPQVEDAE